jgi:ankyrin repeat protein
MRRKPDTNNKPNVLIDAIVGADFSSVLALLDSDRELVAHTVTADRLIDRIHWLYVGDTPLHLAAAALDDRLIELLLVRGANPKAVNRRGATPLHYVCDPRPRSKGRWSPEDQVRIIDRLVRAGAVVDLPDDGGATPLHRAVRARGVAAVQALLKHGPDVSARLRARGSTPLHLAVTGSGAGGTADTRREQLEIVEALLACGADPDSCDARGRTPASAAQSAQVREALARGRDATIAPKRRGATACFAVED